MPSATDFLGDEKQSATDFLKDVDESRDIGTPAGMKALEKDFEPSYSREFKDLSDALDVSPIREGSLTAGVPQYDSQGNQIPSDFEKTVKGLATPKNALLMAATAGEGLLAKAVGALFAGQGAKGAYDAAKVLRDPDADPDAKHDAALSLFTDVPMIAGGAHALLKEPLNPFSLGQPNLPDVSKVDPRTGRMRYSAGEVQKSLKETPNATPEQPATVVTPQPNETDTQTPPTPNAAVDQAPNAQATPTAESPSVEKVAEPVVAQPAAVPTTDKHQSALNALKEQAKSVNESRKKESFSSGDALFAYGINPLISLAKAQGVEADYQMAKTGSDYLILKVPTEFNAAGEATDFETRKYRASTHDASAFREKQFGKNTAERIINPDDRASHEKAGDWLVSKIVQAAEDAYGNQPKTHPWNPENDYLLEKSGESDLPSRSSESTPNAKPSVPTKQAPVAAAPPPETPIVDQPVNKGPGIVGMGGATPSEFERSSGNPTAMRYAKIDLERQQRGLEPLVKPDSVADQVVMDKAMAAIDHDRGLPERLIAELNDRPRPISDLESHVLLLEKIDLKDQYEKSARDAIQAYEDGRKEDMAESNLRTAQWSDKLTELEQASRVSGSERGRALRSLRVMANEDYSLASMEMQKRAAKGGAPLSPDERAELVKQHDELVRTNKAHEDYITAQKDRISSLEASDALKQIQLESARDKIPKINPKILDTAKKIVVRLDKRADAARQRIKDRLKRTSAGVDPTLLVDLAEVGASHLGHAALDFAEWSSKMVEDFGETIRPYLQDAFKASQDLFAKDTAENPLELARAMRERSPEEQIDFNQKKIEENVKSGKKEKINYYVQRLTRLLYQTGIKDRDALVDAVHTRMGKLIPGITRSETMRAIAGYGEFRPLSKDKITTELRGLKGEMQQLSKLEDMAKGEPPLKSGLERRTPTEAERQLIKKVEQAKFEFQVPMTDPSTQLKSALDTYKTSLRNRTADLEDRLKRGDFEKRPRRQLSLDNEAMRLKANSEMVKNKFQNSLNQERLSKRTKTEKISDAIVKWRRGFILSGPGTLAKLTAAAAARAIVTPLEEGVGAVMGKLPYVRDIAARAPREGGFNVKAELMALSQGITEGAKDAWDLIKKGASNLDLVHSKKESLPRAFIDIFGNIHGALKAPVKRAEFARSFHKRMEFYESKGIDVTDEFVQTKIGLEAYQDANRSIFMQPNILNEAYKAALRRLYQKDKKTGNPTAIGKSMGIGTQVLLPIVKVSTNIVAETLEYAGGWARGPVELVQAFRKGIDELEPQQADLILRQIKKGALGLAVMLVCAFNPKILGGFYQQGEKRDKKDIPPDSARIGGKDIPPYILHNPILTAGQIATTVRRVTDSKLNKRDASSQGPIRGIGAGIAGLADSVPFVREATEIGKVMDPHERERRLGAMITSMLVPEGLAATARMLDKNASGETIKRDPKTILESIKTAVPIERETVKSKKNQ